VEKQLTKKNRTDDYAEWLNGVVNSLQQKKSGAIPTAVKLWRGINVNIIKKSLPKINH
jgi:hypothetical protein